MLYCKDYNTGVSCVHVTSSHTNNTQDKLNYDTVSMSHWVTWKK